MQPKIYSLIDKAIYDYDLIPRDSKILVGASGGKDSTLLLEYFSKRLRRKDEHFSVTGLYIQTDFAQAFNPQLKEMIEGWGIKIESLYVNTLERVKEGYKMSCYWCSLQRRKEIIDYAIANGYDTIALGHHLDDVLETLLMNMLRKGSLETMTPKMIYQKYPVKVIRPLYYTPVREIIDYATKSGWQQVTCTCSYQDNSGRKEARRRLEALTAGDDKQKLHMISALKNIRPEYLP